MNRIVPRACTSIVVTLLVTFGAMNTVAQSQFGDKLGFVAVNNSNFSTITGTGWVRATLDGSTLTVEGEFENLGSQATNAHIHLAPPGQHGPVVLPLEFTEATSGTLSGTFELTDEQLRELRAMNFYVNVHTELNPRGEVRAWLIPIE